MISKRFLSAAVLIASLCVPSAILGQDDAQDLAKQEELYAQFAKPGKEHKQLRRLVGNWKVAANYYFDESGKPTESEGTAVFRALMGGRYVQQRFKGEMQGQPFSGIAITGYDNAKKKFVGIWIDDMGTGIMHSEGTYDVKTNTLTETAVSSSPVGEAKFKNVWHFKSDDKVEFEMFMLGPDGERKMMNMTYTRVEKPAKKKKDG